MFSKKLSSTLSIDVPAGVHFVYPPLQQADLPWKELILQGSVTLDLSKPKKVDQVVVTLQNRAVARTSGFLLDEVLLDRTTTVDVHGWLGPGKHTRAFQFPIPVSLVLHDLANAEDSVGKLGEQCSI